MLPKGSISNVINYFTNQPNFVPAMEEALCDFFELKEVKDLSKLNPSQMAFDFFNEWLVFDCELTSRRTVLEEYLFINKDKLSHEYKNLYSDLILTNYYSLFRVDSIKPDENITVTDVFTDKQYAIIERKATRQATVGNYSFWRLAHIGGHYEIVSADGFQIDSVGLPLRIINDWKKHKIKFDPMVIYQQMLKPIETDAIK